MMIKKVNDLGSSLGGCATTVSGAPNPGQGFIWHFGVGVQEIGIASSLRNRTRSQMVPPFGTCLPFSQRPLSLVWLACVISTLGETPQWLPLNPGDSLVATS